MAILKIAKLGHPVLIKKTNEINDLNKVDLKKIVFPNFENGRIKCYIDSVFKLKDVVSSHKYLEGGGHIGKIVIEI